MARKTKEAESSINKAKKEAQRRVRAKVLNESEFDEDEELNEYDEAEGGFGVFSLSDGEPEEVNVEAENSFDIFDYIQNQYSDKGVMVIYTVTKDGHRLQDEYHPCSWTKLQKKYGGGHYAVTAKHGTTKAYIKQQTILVGDTHKEESPEREEKVIQQAPSSPGIDIDKTMSSMLNMFQQMQAMTLEEKSRKDREERRGEEKNTSLIFQMMSENNRSAQEMFMKLSEQQMKSQEALSNNFSKVIEKMEDKTNRMFEKLSEGLNKKQEFGFKEILELREKSEDAGWQKFQMLMELVDARSESKSSDDDGGSGMISKLITGILPILAGASQQQALALHQQQQMQQRVLPPPSQAVRQSQMQQRSPQNPQNPQRPSGQSSAAKVKSQSGKGETSATRENVILTSDDSFDSGLPTRKVKPLNDAEINEAMSDVQVSQDTPMKPGRDINTLFAEATPLQQAVAQTAIPIIVECLEKGIEAMFGAKKTVEVLESNGVNVVLALKEFTEDFMLEIAAGFGMPESTRPWFKEYYAHIENSAGVVIEGPDQSSDGGGSQA